MTSTNSFSTINLHSAETTGTVAPMLGRSLLPNHKATSLTNSNHLVDADAFDPIDRVYEKSDRVIPPDIPASLITRRPKNTQPQTAPMQIWEGTVLSVNKDQLISVLLRSKMLSTEDHTAEIEMGWIHPQDVELVKPGAVFYWMLYKETTKGTTRNAEQIRFRRLPNWTKQQLHKVEREADVLLRSIGIKG